MIAAVRMLLVTVTPMLPLAAIAAWRTSAHAKRWQQDDRDGVAVAEATGCGVVTALLFTLVALPAARSSPLSVLPGMLLVGVCGAVAGACVGLLLFMTAVVVLSLAERAVQS